MRRAAAVGLSIAHNSPQAPGTDTHPYDPSTMASEYEVPYTVEVAVGGSLLKLHGSSGGGTPASGGVRQAVTGFSSASRKRLMELQASINRLAVRHLPLFITLTYPSEFPTDGPTIKAHLDAFLKRLARRFPRVAAIWKLEFQERGAPHFHIMAYGERFIPAQWVAAAWYEVVGSGDTRHLAAGTQVKRIISWRQATYYVAKYIAKVSDVVPIENPGRFWGVHNRVCLPIHLIAVVASYEQFLTLKRTVKRYLTARCKLSPGRRRVRFNDREGCGATLYAEYATCVKLVAWAVPC